MYLRLQNVLEDFRDMDATALEETKATVRPVLPVITHRSLSYLHNPGSLSSMSQCLSMGMPPAWSRQKLK